MQSAMRHTGEDAIGKAVFQRTGRMRDMESDGPAEMTDVESPAR